MAVGDADAFSGKGYGVPINCIELGILLFALRLILVISKRSFVSLGLGSLLVMIIGLVDYYVIQFRSVPLYPWDILSVKTAMSVSDNYNYSLDKDARICVLGFVLLIMIGIFTSWKLPFKKSSVSFIVGTECCRDVCSLWNFGADAGGT